MVGILLLVVTLAFGPRLEVHTSQRVGMAPLQVRLRVHADADPETRYIEVIADSGVEYRASGWTVDPEDGDRTYFVEWTLGQGEYEVWAIAAGPGGKILRRSASLSITVKGVYDGR